MLEVHDLSFSYDDETIVLDRVSFILKKGCIHALLGVNGSGKTTLFDCLSGLLKSDVTLDQNVLQNKLLYIKDDMHFYKNLTGREFVDLIFSLKKKRLDVHQFNTLLETLKMAHKKDDRLSSYSLGTKQKLVLIIGFLMDYDYILMDEPFAAIDFISVDVITQFLKNLKEDGKTIVVSTHQIDIAQEMADDILFLNDGHVHQIPNQFKTPNDLKNYIRVTV
ncbi:ATP-binding cassette domain-containing protein [Lentibacillus saliphilus]|uniref:ATP-binding cassette domain-containing protein n=1 Tax=Lentibacillus saliphilus TaxID=2737028 RepID=UPI001C3091EA|nr:ABC transporter ATP-binding protein [Lentibacillus saliphilus]